MRITSSDITMSASRSYGVTTVEQEASVTRNFENNNNTLVLMGTSEIKKLEVQSGAATFVTEPTLEEIRRRLNEANGHKVRGEQTQPKSVHHEKVHHERAHHGKVQDARGGAGSTVIARPVADSQLVSNIRKDIQSHGVSRSGAADFFSGWSENDLTTLLNKLMEFLDRLNGQAHPRRPDRHDAHRPTQQRPQAVSSGYQVNVSAAAARYQETAAMVSTGSGVVGEANADVISSAQAQSGTVNGHWQKETVTSTFVEGQENTAFRSTGTVRCGDGRTIDFQITLEMSREFESAYVKTTKQEIFTDPLVINMDTDAATISDVSFFFDLNCDGAEEEISDLNDGSGFLALDKNGDGEINDGSELFGAQSGDGFADLAEYDQDGNGWIDEGDEVFSQLKVWTKCGTEDAKLLSLKEADVGAIFLGNMDTQFDLTDATGETEARIRKTGVYLKESDGVGTIQHVDFKA